MIMGFSKRRKLYRSRGGVILGVCEGIANWADFPVSTVRLIFILLVLLAGMSIWVYFILALVIPAESEYSRDYGSSQDSRSDHRRSDKAGREYNKEWDWDKRFRDGQ